MGNQKGKLFELATMYQSYQKKKKTEQPEKKDKKKKAVEVKGHHFDEGKSISLTYNLDMYPEVLHDSHQRQSGAMSMWQTDDTDHSQAFYVESFDAEETVEVPYREVTSDAEDARIEQIVTGFSKNSQEHEDLQDDEEKLGELEEKIDDMLKSNDDDESRSQSLDESSTNIEAPSEQSYEAYADRINEGAPAVSGAQSYSYDASDEDFARDIGAILQGKKVYDTEQKKAIGKETTSVPEKTTPKPAESKDEILDPHKNEHNIFEKIAQSMAFANSYDLGAIALEKKFELMDQEIEKEEVKNILTRPEKTDAESQPGISEAEVVEEAPKAGAMQAEKFSAGVPLDPSNGGRVVKVDQLEKGDLILASSSSSFGVLDSTPGAESIAGLYIGNRKVLTKGDGGTLEEKTLDPDLANKGVFVALRHHNLKPDKASAIVDSLTKLRVGPEKHEVDNWHKIGFATVGVHADVCNSSSDKTKCNAYSGKIQLGTLTNDSFSCAESIINAFEKSQVAFVPTLTKDHNGSMKYFGHLKNKIA